MKFKLINSYLLVFFLLLLLYNETLFGQKAISNPKKAPPSNIFNLSLDKLPPNYRGLNPLVLFNELAKWRLNTPKKGEYETNAEYELRLSKFSSASLSLGIKTQDLIGIVLPQSSYKIEYDADREAFDIDIKPEKRSNCFTASNLWWSCRAFLLSERYFQNGSYIGTNAFGAKIKVRKETEQLLFLELADEPLSSFYFQYSLKVTRQLAPALKPDIAVVVIGNLSKELVTADLSRIAPTRDDPVDLTTKYLVIQFHLKGIWYFNQRTGKIYEKNSLDDEVKFEVPTVAKTEPPKIDTSLAVVKPTTNFEPGIPKIVDVGSLTDRRRNSVYPVYPTAARIVKATGTVRVDITVDEEGKVIAVNAVSGHSLLRSAAEVAARGSTFIPMEVSGHKVKMQGYLIYNFNL